MIAFIKGTFGFDPTTGRYSTTEVMAAVLIGLVVIVTIYEIVTGLIFPHYNDLLMYSIGGATGNKVAKGIATTVQSLRTEKAGEANELGK